MNGNRYDPQNFARNSGLECGIQINIRLAAIDRFVPTDFYSGEGNSSRSSFVLGSEVLGRAGGFGFPKRAGVSL